MSEENKGGAGSDAANTGSESKDEFVSKKAYEETKADMHKYKTMMKEIEAERNQLKADKEAAERESLEEQGKWKELFQKEKESRAKLEADLKQSKDSFVNFHKKNAVISKLGGLKNDEYSKFIDTESIEVQEGGKMSEASIEAEVNRIREKYPEIIKGAVIDNLNNTPAKKTDVAPEKKSAPKTKEDHKKALVAAFTKPQ